MKMVQRNRKYKSKNDQGQRLKILKSKICMCTLKNTKEKLCKNAKEQECKID